MMTSLLNRLGNLGLLLIACGLLLGGLAGAAVAHHYDTLTAANVATHHDVKGKATPKAKPHQVKPKPASPGHGDRTQGNNSADTD
jgi:hypothetical protein